MPAAAELRYSARVDGPNGVASDISGSPCGPSRHIQLGVIRSWVTGEIGGVVAGHAAEDSPLIANRVIDAVGKVVVIVILDESLLEVIHAGDVIAGIVRSPKLLHQGCRERIEPVRGDLITRERRDGDLSCGRVELRRVRIENGPDAAIDIQRLREIALRFQCRRYGPDIAVRVSDFPVFHRKEIEQLILDNGISERAAEHVLTLRILAERRAVGLRAEPRIPSQVEGGAVELVGAGLRGHDDRAAGAVAGLRVYAVLRDKNFL